jgi:hypothetical protein
MKGFVFLLLRNIKMMDASIYAFSGYTEGVQALCKEFGVLPAGSIVKVELLGEKTFFVEEPFVYRNAKVQFGLVHEQWFCQYFFEVENIPLLRSKSAVTHMKEVLLDPCKGAIRSVTRAVEQINTNQEPRPAMRLLIQFVGTGNSRGFANIARAFLSKKSLLTFPFCTRDLQDQLRNQFRCFVKAVVNRTCALQEAVEETSRSLLANVETSLVDMLPMLCCWEPDLHLVYPPNIRNDVWMWLLVNQRLRFVLRDVRLLICAQIANNEFFSPTEP